MILRISHNRKVVGEDADHSGLPLLASPPTACVVNQYLILDTYH
jgi:hypothetical protein